MQLNGLARQLEMSARQLQIETEIQLLENMS